MTTVYVSTFNHLSVAGVAEIAELLTNEFQRIGLSAVSRRELPIEAVAGDMILLVEEFSEPLVVDALRRFRGTHPGIKLICILTEFFTPGSTTRPPGLNTFKEPYRSLLFDNLLYVYSHLRGNLKLFSGNRLGAPGLVQYLLAFIGGLWLALAKAWRPSVPIRKNRVFQERTYLWFRFLGLCSAQDLFDGFLALHPAIASDPLAAILGTNTASIRTLLVPPPQVDKKDLVDPQLEFGLDLSGTLNRFRQKQVAKVADRLHKLSPTGRLSVTRKRGFDDAQHKLLLSFNMPLSPTWCYSSPMRIIGAIKRGQIPVVSRKFGDHPAEDLALLLPTDPDALRTEVAKLLFKRLHYIEEAWNALQRYMRLSVQNNGEIIRRLLDENGSLEAGRAPEDGIFSRAHLESEIR